MSIRRMDNVGIVVDDLDAAIAFCTELGMELEGRAEVEGPWADTSVGIRDSSPGLDDRIHHGPPLRRRAAIRNVS